MPSVPIRFPGHEAELAGEVVLPEGAGTFAAVVLLHGTGEGAREYYRAHAEAFAAAGAAALIFDRRGEGESSGARNMNTEVLAKDAAGAVAALRALEAVDAARVGLWGYSNGAWAAALAASFVDAPAFLVLAGASGVTPGASEVFRRTELLRAHGVSAPTMAAVHRTWEIVFHYMAEGEWDDSWDAALARARGIIEADPAIATFPESELVRSDPRFDPVPRLGTPPLANLRESLRGAAPEMGFDPIPVLATLTCPVLVVLAEYDENLPVAQSLPRFEALAHARGDGSFRIEVLPGADHRFSTPEFRSRVDPNTPAPPRPRADYYPGYLDLMADWVAASGLEPRPSAGAN